MLSGSGLLHRLTHPFSSSENEVAHVVLTPQWLWLILFHLFLFWWLLARYNWGMGVVVFEVLHLLPHLIRKPDASLLTYAKVALAILLASLFGLRDYQGIKEWALLLIVILNMSIFYELETGRLVAPRYLTHFLVHWLNKCIDYFLFVVHTALQYTRLFRRWDRELDQPTVRRILVGLIFALPVLGVLIMLFATADQYFEQFLMNLFKNLHDFVIRFKWLQELITFPQWLVKYGLFWLYLTLVLPPVKSLELGSAMWLKARYLIEKATIASLVSGVFGLFIVTQFKTFSVILAGFQTGQLNPSLFVREGFMQLMVACAIGLGIFELLKEEVTLPESWSSSSKFKKAAFWLALGLLGEIMLVNLIAAERVWLYQWEFGLTRARFLGVGIVVILGAAVMTLAGELYQKLTRTLSIQCALLVIAGVVAAGGFLDVDRLVASWRPPMVNHQIDYGYILSLSLDAAPAWSERVRDVKADVFNGLPSDVSAASDLACTAKLVEYKDEFQFTQALADRLDSWEGRYFGYYFDENSQMMASDRPDICAPDQPAPAWQSFNASRWSALSQLCRKMPELLEFQQRYLSVCSRG